MEGNIYNTPVANNIVETDNKPISQEEEILCNENQQEPEKVDCEKTQQVENIDKSIIKTEKSQIGTTFKNLNFRYDKNLHL